MTTIAYRAGIMAADSFCTADNVFVGLVSKKIALNKQGWLGGAAGNAIFARKWLEWFESDFEESTVPTPAKNGEDSCNGNGLMVGPKGTIRIIEDAGYFDLEGEYYAIGSGMDFALGALAHGATAEEAVAAALVHDRYSGGPIVTVRRDAS